MLSNIIVICNSEKTRIKQVRKKNKGNTNNVLFILLYYRNITKIIINSLTFNVKKDKIYVLKNSK